MVFLAAIQRWGVLRDIRKAEMAIKNAQGSQGRSVALNLAVCAVRDARKKQWLVDDTKSPQLLLVESTLESALQNKNSVLALEALETARGVINRKTQKN